MSEHLHLSEVKAALRTKEDFEHKLALGLELFPERKQAKPITTFEKITVETYTDIWNPAQTERK